MKRYLICMVGIVLLPGCGRIVDWARDSINQGCALKNYRRVPCEFLRSTTVYNQIETVCTFDALWLSDSVRTAYAQLLACKYCKDPEHEKAFLCAQFVWKAS